MLRNPWKHRALDAEEIEAALGFATAFMYPGVEASQARALLIEELTAGRARAIEALDQATLQALAVGLSFKEIDRVVSRHKKARH